MKFPLFVIPSYFKSKAFNLNFTTIWLNYDYSKLIYRGRGGEKYDEGFDWCLYCCRVQMVSSVSTIIAPRVMNKSEILCFNGSFNNGALCILWWCVPVFVWLHTYAEQLLIKLYFPALKTRTTGDVSFFFLVRLFYLQRGYWH